LLTSTIIPTPPSFSLQYPLSSKEIHNISFANRDRSLIPLYDTFIEYNQNKYAIPPAMYRLNYSGIFLVDAADTLFVMSSLEIIHWFLVSRGQSKDREASFYLPIRYIR
jgi:hypothetical protein